MPDQAPLYDLNLLLSPDSPEEQRTKVLTDVESAITSAGGEIERNDNWGRRPLAYLIRHQPEAEYHLLQFKAPGNLIEELSHTLRITDGVVRFRVIKVRPGTPPLSSSPPPVVAAASGSSGASAGSGTSRGSASAPQTNHEAAGSTPSSGGEPPDADEPAGAEEPLAGEGDSDTTAEE